MSEQPEFSELRKRNIETEAITEEFDPGVERQRAIKKTGQMNRVAASFQVFCHVQHSVILSPDGWKWEKWHKDQYTFSVIHNRV